MKAIEVQVSLSESDDMVNAIYDLFNFSNIEILVITTSRSSAVVVFDQVSDKEFIVKTIQDWFLDPIEIKNFEGDERQLLKDIL